MIPHAYRSPTLLLLLAVPGGCAERAAAGSSLLDEQVPEAARYGGTAATGITADVNDVNPLTQSLAGCRPETA
jgi:hypothetical protein